jgi:hypothetical protein
MNLKSLKRISIVTDYEMQIVSKHTSSMPSMVLLLIKTQFLAEPTNPFLFGLRRLLCHEGINARSCFGAFHCEAVAFSAAAEDFESRRRWRRRRRRDWGAGRRDGSFDLCCEIAEDRHVCCVFDSSPNGKRL